MKSWRRRFWYAVAVTAFVVGFVALYVQSHNANERRSAANRSVRDNAQRYANRIVAATTSGPLTGSRLLRLRTETYRDGGGLRQGISHVGANAGGRALTVTFQVQVDFRGSFHAAARTINCYRAVVSTLPTRPRLSAFSAMDCDALLPDVAPAAVLTSS